MKQIKSQIRELRLEMREAGIKRVSCFNGGLDSVTYRYNAKLFTLETELKSQKDFQKAFTPNKYGEYA